MKRLLIFITIVSILVSSQFALGADVDDLRAANQTLFQAWNSLDAKNIASIISQGGVGFGFESAFPSVGPVESTQAERAAFINMLIENVDYIFMNPYNIQCRVFEDTGIIWGYVSVISKERGGTRQAWYLRYTSTWIKSDGQWLTVMNHYSTIPSGN